MCSGRLLDIYYEVEVQGREAFRGREAFGQAETESPLLVSRLPPEAFVIYKWSLQDVVWSFPLPLRRAK